ncbi:MAG: hypothetical protein EXS08_15490 [Planctomycetes bacterium]|nr:hypothetical protein [Planctomycetota bacterium]
MKESPVEALRMMRRIAKLFDVEREAARALRAEKSQPVLVEIEAEAQALRSLATSDQGPLAKALTHLENQWPTLLRFLEDGRVPIHNNSCENALRPLAVGRKNWLFGGSERGGQAAATI